MVCIISRWYCCYCYYYYYYFYCRFLFNITYKTYITYKTLSTDQPPYSRNLLNPYRPSRSLRSPNRNLLLISPHNTNFSRRAFSFAAPTVWNKLPTGIRESNTLCTFKHRLKHSSHLFPVNQRPHPRPPSDCPRLRFDVLLVSALCALQIIVLYGIVL